MNPLTRFLYRAPTHLYDHGLGWLLTRRFLCLTHVGRKSGRRYRTVLEVLGTDPQAGEYIVIAGYGPTADWFRNIQKRPAEQVVVGRTEFTPEHRVLDIPEAITRFAAYERRNRLIGPVLRPYLGTLLGWRYDGSAHARRRLVEQLPMVAFRPRA